MSAATLLWAAWVAGVGLLAALAAYIVEPVARALRWPTRWLWAAAMAAQLAAIAVAIWSPDAARPAAWFVAVWIAATGVACVVYLRALRVLGRERGGWRLTIAEEMPVWVSERTGPAVVGFLRSIVVAPAWALALADRERRLLLRHEAEHVSAWDPTLLLAGLATCALVPWSPAAWWALARLRLAIEVDCDRRVLATDPDVATYGELLVAVQGRVVPGAAAIAAFSERRLPIEERIEAMTARAPRGAAWRWSVRLLAAGSLVLAACMAPRPTTTTVAGGIRIQADRMKVRHNEDGSQTITAKNATITTHPDTTARPASVTIPTVDSATFASLARTLDSVKQSGDAERLLERLRAGGNQQREAQERTEYEQRRANALAFATLREHFHRADVEKPAPGHMALFALDENGVILRRRDVDVRDSSDRISISPMDLRRHFPDLPRGARSYNAGVTSSESFGLDATASVAWWMVGEPPRSAWQKRLDAAIARLFPAGAPVDTAVGVLVLTDRNGNVVATRRVNPAAIPTSPPWSIDSASRLLPELRGRAAPRMEARTRGDVVGLAEGSAVYEWNERDDMARGAEPEEWSRRVIAAVHKYAVRERLDTLSAPVTVRLLLAADWSVRGIRHDALIPRLPPGWILEAFPEAAGDTVTLRGGVMKAPAELLLPAGSTVAWQQLAPPRVIEAVPAKP